LDLAPVPAPLVESIRAKFTEDEKMIGLNVNQISAVSPRVSVSIDLPLFQAVMDVCCPLAIPDVQVTEQHAGARG
jgi:hypothetical protein